MSAAGKRELYFNEYSSKVIELVDAEIKVYDVAGKQVNKYKKRDMFTSAIGEGLVDEGNVTYFEVTANTYPITVEFNYELKLKGTLQYPPYEIQSSGEAVQNSTFTAKVPLNLDLRYKEKTSTYNRQLSRVINTKHIPGLLKIFRRLNMKKAL